MSHVTLVRLKRQAKQLGITHDLIAEATRVGRTLVSHVLAGRAKSSNVLATTKRLIDARRAGDEEAERARSSGVQRVSRPPRRLDVRRSTARSLLKHATGWAGNDLAERLAEVYATRFPTRG